MFDTYGDSRKAQNLRKNPRIAVVIGWDEGKTVQYEGVVDEPQGEELARLKAIYLARFPDGHERERDPRTTYFRARPTWIRWSEFTKIPPEIEVVDLTRLS